MSDKNRGEHPGDELIASQKLEFKSRDMFLDIKKNRQGKFLKISELKNGHRNVVMVDGNDLAEFYNRLVDLMMDAGYLEDDRVAEPQEA